MERHTRMLAIREYIKYMANVGHKVLVEPSGLVIRRDMPFLGCTLDGKVIDPVADPYHDIIEVKIHISIKE